LLAPLLCDLAPDGFPDGAEVLFTHGKILSTNMTAPAHDAARAIAAKITSVMGRGLIGEIHIIQLLLDGIAGVVERGQAQENLMPAPGMSFRGQVASGRPGNALAQSADGN
jgi:hypothetical protein